MQLLLPGSRYPDSAAQVRFYRRLFDGARSAPGVQSAAVATTLPMSGSSLGAGFTVDGRPLANPADRPTAAGFAISPEYFETMGIQLVRGRSFDARDAEDAPPVAIINETMARRFWAERGSDRPPAHQLRRRVARDRRHRSRREEPGSRRERRSAVVHALPQTPWPFLAVVVRTTADPAGLSGDAAPGDGRASIPISRQAKCGPSTTISRSRWRRPASTPRSSPVSQRSRCSSPAVACTA